MIGAVSIGVIAFRGGDVVVSEGFVTADGCVWCSLLQSHSEVLITRWEAADINSLSREAQTALLIPAAIRLAFLHTLFRLILSCDVLGGWRKSQRALTSHWNVTCRFCSATRRQIMKFSSIFIWDSQSWPIIIWYIYIYHLGDWEQTQCESSICPALYVD